MELKKTMINALTALDGRYAPATTELTDIFSEYGLIKYRVFVEIEWLKFILFDLKLSQTKDIDTIARVVCQVI